MVRDTVAPLGLMRSGVKNESAAEQNGLGRLLEKGERDAADLGC